MSLFKKKRESINVEGIKLLDRYKEGELDEKEFLSAFGKETVYYATPYDADGSNNSSILFSTEDSEYYPAFTSVNRLIEFYEEAGRADFMVNDGPFLNFLEMAKATNGGANAVSKGAIVDPECYDFSIEDKHLDILINMMKG